MTAEIYNYTIEQGSTFRRVIPVISEGLLVNLTGCQARMHCRQSFSDPNAYFKLDTSTLGGLTIDPLAGTVTMFLSADVTAALNFGTAYYDLEIVSAGNEVYRYMQGTVTLSPEVTHG